MTVLRGNSLTSISNFRKREIRRWVEQIPEDRRATLLEEIQARSFLFQEGDTGLLNLAIKYLKGDKK